MVTQKQVRTWMSDICYLIWSRHQEQSQIGFFYSKRPIFLHACATRSELPSNIRTKGCGIGMDDMNILQFPYQLYQVGKKFLSNRYKKGFSYQKYLYYFSFIFFLILIFIIYIHQLVVFQQQELLMILFMYALLQYNENNS